MVDDDAQIARVGSTIPELACHLDAGVREGRGRICPARLRSIEGAVDRRVMNCIPNILGRVKRESAEDTGGTDGSGLGNDVTDHHNERGHLRDVVVISIGSGVTEERVDLDGLDEDEFRVLRESNSPDQIDERVGGEGGRTWRAIRPNLSGLRKTVQTEEVGVVCVVVRGAAGLLVLYRDPLGVPNLK